MELAEMMLALAKSYAEYGNAKKVRLIQTTHEAYYGEGYQDVQNRVPKIDNTCRELAWRPRVSMAKALKLIFDAYRGHMTEARHLSD
jgi:nucleoside-diphosphate-sugar epimerase